MSGSKFDETEYLVVNPDVAAAVEAGVFRSGQEHYKRYGKKEGRMLKRSDGGLTREDKVFHYLDKKGFGLEIGPSHNPFAPKKTGITYISLIMLAQKSCVINIRGMALT